jgi:hypothetical protein
MHFVSDSRIGGKTMPFEIFERKVRRSGSPFITFNKLGRLSMNKTATARLERDAVEFVLLLWDASKRQIGIRPITKRDSRAYRLAYGKKGNGAGFSAKTFMDYVGYDYKESRSVPIRWDEGESMFIGEVPAEYLQQQRQQPLLVERQSGKKAGAK